ncbi:MAG: GntR family transcriptional regulator [Acidimicrobiia bacterium]
MKSSTEDPTPLAPSRVEVVYRQLREAIVNGDFAPGAPLRHQDLTETYDVSLVPIREAIRKLEAERLVESIPNRGARVAPISAGEVEDVYATRLILEEEALRKAAAHLSEDDLAVISSLQRRLAALPRRDKPDFNDLHRRVHFSLYERCNSPWLLHMIEILWSHTERHRRLAAHLRTHVEMGDDHHGPIVDAIAEGEIEEAVLALRTDLQWTSTLLVEAYNHSGT